MNFFPDLDSATTALYTGQITKADYREWAAAFPDLANPKVQRVKFGEAPAKPRKSRLEQLADELDENDLAEIAKTNPIVRERVEAEAKRKAEATAARVKRETETAHHNTLANEARTYLGEEYSAALDIQVTRRMINATQTALVNHYGEDAVRAFDGADYTHLPLADGLIQYQLDVAAEAAKHER
jgi:hypothetical protein